MPIAKVEVYSRGSARSAAVRDHQIATMVSPVGGINSRVALASQTSDDAVDLVNAFTRPYGIELRSGYRIWQNNLTNPVRTLMSFRDRDPTVQKLFACTLTGIYDVTLRTNNPSEPTPDVTNAFQSAEQSDIWSHTNFASSAISYLVSCNAGNGYWTYDTAGGWIQRVEGVAAGEINGTDPTQFTYVMEWKQRLFFLKDKDTVAWYLPVNQVAGDIVQFDFGPYLAHGGYIAAMLSWTRDGGDGSDDFLVIIGSQGDIVVYQGTDPASAVTFSMSGAWYLGRVPVGNRFFENLGGDVYLLSSSGLVSLDALTRGVTVDEAATLSYKIETALTNEFSLRSNEQTWEVLYFSNSEILVVKVPDRNSEPNWAFVSEIHSKGWSTLNNMPMVTIEEHEGFLFGSDIDGNVFRLLDGDFDNIGFDDLPGEDLEMEIQTGFLAIANADQLKTPHLVSPVFLASTAPSVRTRINTEFHFGKLTGAPLSAQSDQSQWDVSLWDQAAWGGGPNTYESWQGAEGLGHYLSLKMTVRGLSGTLFTNWRLIYELGSVM